MKALVTGARGFCGKHLTRYLMEQGVEVYGVSHQSEASSRNFLIRDLTDWRGLAEVVAAVRPTYVFHLAGVSTGIDPPLFYRVNCQYAVALLHALEQTNQRDCPILLAGTSAEYGLVRAEDLPIVEDLPPRPYNHYGVSKLAQTLAGGVAAENHRPVVRVRPFNVIGPGMPGHLVVQSFARQVAEIRKGERPPVLDVGNLETVRDFLGIEELVRIYWQLIRTPAAYGEIINVCSGKGTGVREVLQTLIQLGGCPVDVRIDPARIKEIDIPVHYGSVKKLEQILGWTPGLNLKPILQDMLEV